MDTRCRIFAITAFVAALTLIASVAIAGTPSRVIFSATGGYQGTVSSRIDVCAQEGSACAQDEGTVRVRLLKLKDGSWVKVAGKLAEWADASWQVRFTGAPRRGQCKLVAAYSGAEEWAPSKGSIKGRCNDGDWLA